MESLLTAPAITLALLGILGLIGLATALIKKLRNGNGSPKLIQITDAVIRGIISEAMETQRGDAERRHAEMIALLKDIRDINATNFEIIRERLHDLSTPLMVATQMLQSRDKR